MLYSMRSTYVRPSSQAFKTAIALVAAALGVTSLGACGARSALDVSALASDANDASDASDAVDAVVPDSSVTDRDGSTDSMEEALDSRPPPTIVELATSGASTCARSTENEVWCWGVGALSGSTRDLTPTRVVGIGDARQIAIGWYGRMVLRASGRVFAWGHGYFDGSTAKTVAEPEELILAPKAAAIAQGADFHCVLSTDESVWCWGDNQSNEIGVPRVVPYEQKPIRIASVTGAKSVVAGGGHACALIAGGTVSCWGNNSDGQLGDPAHASFAPRTIPAMHDVIEVAAGDKHTCVLLGDRSVWCWGRNSYGEVGDGTMELRDHPVLVKGLDDARHIAAGGVQTCAIRADDSVVCWGGAAPSTAPGAPPPLGRTTPTPIAGLGATKQVVVGYAGGCALSTSGRVLCWGANSFGQLGDGSTTASTTPVAPKF